MKSHRVYTLFRNLEIAFWVTVTAVIVCTAALPCELTRRGGRG